MYKLLGGSIIFILVLGYLGFNLKDVLKDSAEALGVEKPVIEKIEYNINNKNYEEAGKIMRGQIDKVVDPRVREKIYQMYLHTLHDMVEAGKVNKENLENFIMKLNIDDTKPKNSTMSNSVVKDRK